MRPERRGRIALCFGAEGVVTVNDNEPFQQGLEGVDGVCEIQTAWPLGINMEDLDVIFDGLTKVCG